MLTSLSRGEEVLVQAVADGGEVVVLFHDLVPFDTTMFGVVFDILCQGTGGMLMDGSEKPEGSERSLLDQNRTMIERKNCLEIF